mgnify:CR=1 FL=1
MLQSVTFANDSQNSSASTRTVRFTVTDTGDVQDAKVIEQNGSSRQASEALEAVRAVGVNGQESARTFDLSRGACEALVHCYTGPIQWKYAKP